jgi:hypothetical protein
VARGKPFYPGVDEGDRGRSGRWLLGTDNELLALEQEHMIEEGAREKKGD